MRDLKNTLVTLPLKTSLFAYLMSSMFYRDALSGLYIFGGIYAAGVLGWGTFQLGVFGIVAALSGAVGAWIGGRADQRLGPETGDRIHNPGSDDRFVSHHHNQYE